MQHLIATALASVLIGTRKLNLVVNFEPVVNFDAKGGDHLWQEEITLDTAILIAVSRMKASQKVRETSRRENNRESIAT